MSETSSAEQPRITRGTYIRTIGRMTRHLTEAPEIPSLAGAVGLYGEMLHDLTGQHFDLSPGSMALKGLRYSFLKCIDDFHRPYALTDDHTTAVTYRHLNEAAFSSERPYVGVRNAIIDGEREGWARLTYSREWPRVARILDLNDAIIPIDPSSELTPQPLRAKGMAVGADSSFEASAGALVATIASYNSRTQYPNDLKDDPDHIHQVALDVGWGIGRGYRPFQPIFMGRQALSYINFGLLKVELHRDKWVLQHQGTLDNSHPDDPPAQTPHIGCIAGVRPREQEVQDEESIENPAGEVTNLHRVVWAGINASLRAQKAYSWKTARHTWRHHPRRTLDDATLKRYLAMQHRLGSPKVDGPSSELLNYHLACHKWV